jgi:5'-3' exonuclease
LSLTWGRYQAAAEPVDLEKLKISEEEEQEDVAMEDVAEDEEEEEEEDAALEDIKDLYDDDEGTGKKRKRPATDDGEDQKTGRKKVHYLTKFRLTVEIGSGCTTNEKT